MPVHHFAVAGLVGYIDGDGPAFSEPEQRAGHLAVIRNGLDGSVSSDLKLIGCDVDGVIGGSELLGRHVQSRGCDGQAGELEYLSPCNQALA